MTRAKALVVLFAGLGLVGLAAYNLRFGTCSLTFCTGFVLPYNVPDHFNYLMSVALAIEDGLLAALRLNHGIAALYALPGSLLADDPAEGATMLSFVLNPLFYLCSIVAVLALGRRLGVPAIALLPLTLFPPYFFFGGLINKDMVLMFLLPAVVLALQRRRWISVAVLTLLIGMTRAQYLAFPLLTLFLMRGVLGPRLVVAYVTSALGAAMIARWTGFFEFDTAGLGVSDFVYRLNQQYLVGALLFNPLRVAQYLYALAASWRLVWVPEGVNLMAVSEGLAFLWYVALLPGLLRTFAAPRHVRRHPPWRAAVAPVLAYLMVMLLTPITEPRYLMPLYPLALLAAGVSHPRSRLRLDATPREQAAPPAAALPG